MASGGASRLRRAVKRIGFSCATFSSEVCFRDPHKNISSPWGSAEKTANGEEGTAEEGDSNPAKQILCTICLEPLDCDGTGEKAIYTAQCMHSFHFTCISSHVRHGSVTCPICRAHWTQLPRDLTAFRIPPCNQTSDPILRILDDSIATFRVHRRSSLRSSRYDDDEPVEIGSIPTQERLQMSLIPIPVLPSPETLPDDPLQFTSSPSLTPRQNATFGLCLSMKLLQQQATDVALVVSPNGPHLRLLKQAMALVVFSLRPPDRLAIVTYSSAATRALPLRRMTSVGKRAALQVINRLFYLGEADPIDGLKKGAKILEDRRHQNSHCCILHLSDSPTRSYISRDLEVPIPIHCFHIGFGYGASNGFVMHEFEEFVLRLLGGVVRETQLRIGDEGVLIRIGELRGGEERRIPLGLIGESEYVCVGYSYIEEGVEECLRTGEVLVGFAEKGEWNEGGYRQISMDSGIGGRSRTAARWDYIDPFMARRWARHLHGYRS